MKYQVSQDRDFEKYKTLTRREARKLLNKTSHSPDFELDELDTGKRQVVSLLGWGWLRTEPRARVKGATANKKRWWNAGIEDAVAVLSKSQVKARREGYEAQADTLLELEKKLKDMRR